MYVLCGDWRLAGKECKDRGDKAKMEYVPFSDTGHLRQLSVLAGN